MVAKKQKNNMQQAHDEEDKDGQGGQGGQSTSIDFVDFVSSDQYVRDDLSETKLKHLLVTHADEHELRVKKQKEERENRKALKEGKKSYHQYDMYSGQSTSNSNCRSHPILSQAAQFSGMDKQVTNLPSENVADTNHTIREQLSNEYRMRYAPRIQPKFNPKPNYP